MCPSKHPGPTSALRRAVLPALVVLWSLATPPGAAGETTLLPANALKHLSLEQLLDVEVTSISRHPEKLLETASAIQVVSHDDIIRSGATSLPEALRLAPNLEVAQKNPHDWGISARGFNAALSNKLLVMIDGRTVYTPLFSGVFWDVQDYLLEDVSRIEVVSGPGATLWGANAVNGVINVTTKSAKDTQGLYIEGGAGTELRDFGAVRYGATVAPNVYLRVYGQTSDRDSAVSVTGVDAPDSYTMHRGGFRLDAESWDNTTLTLQGDLYRGSEYVVTGGIQKVGGGNLLGRWSREWSPTSNLIAQVYYDRTHLVDPITNSFGSVKYLTDDLDTYDFDVQHRIAIGEQHQLVWGGGFRLVHDAVQNASNTAFFPTKVDHELTNVFAQDEFTLRPTVTLTFGSKFEYNDYTGFELEPSARLAWRATPHQTLWTAVSRAVRMPSRYDRDIVQPAAPPAIATGSKSFQSEVVRAYEAGYRAQLTEAVTTSLSIYYNDYDRLRSFGPAATALRPPFSFGNYLSARTYGLEWSARYEVSADVRLRASYNYLDEHLRMPPGHIDLFNGRNEVSDPKHQASLGASFDLPFRLTFDVNARWVDTLQTPGGPVPSYAEADAHLAWRANDHVEVSLTGQNLLHDHHPEFGIAGPRREELQRSVYAKVAIRW